MKRIKKLGVIIGCAMSFGACAGTMGPIEKPHPWYMSGNIGYTWYNFGYAGGPTADPDAQTAIGDGQTAFGRFAIGKELISWHPVSVGLEVGVQSGNIQRIDVSQDTLDLLGGLPIQANIKPMLDLLVTGKTQLMSSRPVFSLVKLGIAYRRLQINERVTVNDLSQVGFEVQAGLGADVSERASLSILYQGVFDGAANFTVNTASAVGHISNIPAQNGLMLNLTYKL